MVLILHEDEYKQLWHGPIKITKVENGFVYGIAPSERPIVIPIASKPKLVPKPRPRPDLTREQKASLVKIFEERRQRQEYISKALKEKATSTSRG